MNTKQVPHCHRGMRREIAALLRALKADIDDEYRCSDDADDNTPGMCVTVATSDGQDWVYQTGDNSFTGACYHRSHWAVIYLYRRSNCDELAKAAIEEMNEGLFSEFENQNFKPNAT